MGFFNATRPPVALGVPRNYAGISLDKDTVLPDDLSGASFKGAEILDRSALLSVTHRGASLEGTIIGHHRSARLVPEGEGFNKMVLVLANLRGACFGYLDNYEGEISFRNCDLAGSQFQSPLLARRAGRLSFDECDMTGVRMARNLMGSVSFFGSKLTGIVAEGARFIGANFAYANLSAAKLAGADLGAVAALDSLDGVVLESIAPMTLYSGMQYASPSKFDGATLVDTDLRASSLIGINWSTVGDISEADFNGAEVDDEGYQFLLANRDRIKPLEYLILNQGAVRESDGTISERRFLVLVNAAKRNFLPMNFETARSYYADTTTDMRGDDFFQRFAEKHPEFAREIEMREAYFNFLKNLGFSEYDRRLRVHNYDPPKSAAEIAYENETRHQELLIRQQEDEKAAEKRRLLDLARASAPQVTEYVTEYRVEESDRGRLPIPA